MICFTDFWQKGPKLTKGVRRPRSEKSSGQLISKSPLRRGREDQLSLKMKKDIEDNPTVAQRNRYADEALNYKGEWSTLHVKYRLKYRLSYPLYPKSCKVTILFCYHY